MRWFWKLFPLIIVEWLAKKYCGRISQGGLTVVQPFKGTLFIVKDKDEILRDRGT